LRNIRTIGVYGLGTMGHGIAQVFATSGFEVIGYEADQRRAEAALKSIRANLDLFEKEGLVGPGEAAVIAERVVLAGDPIGLAGTADYIVEAIPEILEPKQVLVKEISGAAAPDVIIATNTSGLDPSDIAVHASHPERVIAAHYWNPPHLLPLVEVTRGEKTSDETLERTVDLMRQTGKQPVVLKRYVPGFSGNRLQWALFREALSLVETGVADPEDVDTVMTTSLGRRLAAVGPFETADMGGLDIHLAVGTYLLKILDRSTEPSAVIRAKVEHGDLGLKTGTGFYDWSGEEGRRKCEQRDRLLMALLKRAKTD
jgi:3-hydroxybutyryl-CoA dehydrogenase